MNRLWKMISLMLAIASSLCPGTTSQAVDPNVLEAQQRRIETLDRISPAVVAIFGEGGRGGGSGILISPDGFALSNFHVTSGAGDFMKCGLNDGRLYDAVIVGIDPTGDVALIRMLGRDDFPHVPFGDSDALRVGDWVYALGNPFLLATDFHPTVTYGIVSGTHRYQYPAGTFLEYTDCIQVDASINPGNSGGPLFNSAGELVGINGRGSFEKRGRVNSGAGYAISINQIAHFMDHLKSGRVVDHASFGATVTTQNDGAVIIDRILEGSDAWRRGMRDGDELVSFAGRPIRSVNQFKNILGIYPRGWRVPVVFRNDKGAQQTHVRLAALHRESEMDPTKAMPGRRRKPPGSPKPGQPRPDQPKQRPGTPHVTKPESKLPAKYKKMLIKKPGFSNYYFNKLAQDRLLESLRKYGDFKSNNGTWILHGTNSNGDAFEIVVADKAVGYQSGKDSYYQPSDDPVVENEPRECPGLIHAFAHLRQMLAANRKGDVYYLGSEPLDGNGATVDVLIMEDGVVTTRWLFDQSSGEWIGFDATFGTDFDACEIRITSFQESDGRRFPRELVVRSGENDFGTLTIDSVEFRDKKADAP
jgi:serine protease Do